MVLQINEIIVVVFLFIIIKKNVKMTFPKQTEWLIQLSCTMQKKYLAVAEVQKHNRHDERLNTNKKYRGKACDNGGQMIFFNGVQVIISNTPKMSQITLTKRSVKNYPQKGILCLHTHQEWILAGWRKYIITENSYPSVSNP